MLNDNRSCLVTPFCPYSAEKNVNLHTLCTYFECRRGLNTVAPRFQDRIATKDRVTYNMGIVPA